MPHATHQLPNDILIGILRETENFELDEAVNRPRYTVDGTPFPALTNAEIAAQADFKEALEKDLPHREGPSGSSA